MRNLHALLIAIFIAIITTFSCTKTNLNNSNALDNSKSKTVTPNVLQCGTGYHWDYYLKKCVPDCPTGYHNDSITGACVVDGGNGGGVVISYAGVKITYYSNTQLLSFNNPSDVNTVLNQLDADYENYNTAYENQYPNYTSDQLDSLDSVNNFDQLKTYRDFEAKFLGFTSERSTIENLETNWLNNDRTGIDPDSVDLAIDNSENAICNSNYELMISGNTYQWTTNGLVLAGGLIMSPASGTTCFTNRKRWSAPLDIGNRSFRIKAAIHYCLIRSSVKAKVKSYKLSHGKWKRARYDLSVGVWGNVYASDCNTMVNINLINPSSGYKKRRELKVIYRDWGISSAYYTRSGELGGNFATPIAQGSIIIQ